MSTNKLMVIYKHELEPERNEVTFFNSLSDLKIHIQNETCEFLGDDNFEAEDMNVLNKDNVYYEEDFGMYHSWTVFEAVITSAQEKEVNNG